MITTQEKQQRVLLVGLNRTSGTGSGHYDAEDSLAELSELAEAAGAEVCGQVLQNRPDIDNATYIGKGKLQEVKEFCGNHEIDLVIVDDELSGAQIRNISESTGVDAIDRTMLILDIFAGRALSREGKLQVELAQQKYLLPRLIGMGKVLSRQGAGGGRGTGIGTRGPGETKLESDRRHIRSRIQSLEKGLEELAVQRERVRERRAKNGVPSVAIVGYTNVGKSTLLNRLTDAGVLVKDQLFATLDPTARELLLPDGRKVILIDTVGLISRLPHQLVQAFHSTLEEAANADVLVNLCDASAPGVQEQLNVSRSLLNELGCGDIPTITAFNKIDRVENADLFSAEGNGRSVFLSAVTGEGIKRLLEAIAAMLPEPVSESCFRIPYTEGSQLDWLRRQGHILSEDYVGDGVLVRVLLDKQAQERMKDYQVDTPKEKNDMDVFES